MSLRIRTWSTRRKPTTDYAAPTMLRINSTTFVSRFDSWNAEKCFTPEGSSPPTSGERFFQRKTLVFLLYFRHRIPYDTHVKLILGHSIAILVVFIIGKVLFSHCLTFYGGVITFVMNSCYRDIIRMTALNATLMRKCYSGYTKVD